MWLAGLGCLLWACSADEPLNRDETTCTESAEGRITNNHNHRMRAICEEDRGNSLSLSLSHTDHSHGLELSSQDVAAILDGEEIDPVSTVDSDHVHRVWYNEAP